MTQHNYRLHGEDGSVQRLDIIGPTSEMVTMNTTSNRLPELQALILAAHHDAQRHAAAAAEKALSAGEMLVEAKGLCRHGEWGNWLKATGISERSAQRYMLLHRAGFNSATVADLGFDLAEHYATTALKMLPPAGHALAVLHEREGKTGAFTYWWWEGSEWAGYAHVNENFYIVPYRPMRPWLVAKTHEEITAELDLDITHLRDVPLQEALDFRRQFNIAAIGSRLPIKTARRAVR